MRRRSSKKRPRDANAMAAQIVAEAVGAALPQESNKDPLAVELGRRGGEKGGRARARSLTPERRREIARLAAKARWDKR